MKINKVKYIINAINRLIDLKVINLTIVHTPVCEQQNCLHFYNLPIRRYCSDLIILMQTFCDKIKPICNICSFVSKHNMKTNTTLIKELTEAEENKC